MYTEVERKREEIDNEAAASVYGYQGIALDEKPIPKRCYSGQMA
jgi:hypothetical protein